MIPRARHPAFLRITKISSESAIKAHLVIEFDHFEAYLLDR